MKVIACSQARYDSTRLPGKVLQTVNGQSLLQYHITRLKLSKSITEHVIATSDHNNDDGVAVHCLQQGVRVFRGSKLNVLQRFADVVQMLALGDDDRIVRLTADCPLVDAQLVDQLIAYHLERGDDYSSLYIGEHIRGFDAEVMSVKALKRAAKNAIEEFQKEHVTPYLYQHPELFQISQFKVPCDYQNSARLCIDESSDLEMFTQLVMAYPGEISSAQYINILGFLKQYPEITMLNQDVKQKKLGE
ncbi:glycosyltransferase family protein [Pseudoalteromonas sp. SWN29]|uniref:cytidylyltransferase domain-containing protein n=1 Tax=Pseudoalteromonas sp. SWN29 TaxID=2792064 RepID=UPI0018CD6DE3|nr:glycosyltransferase family protein [Pseudoalteromonas sp. SWN29]MBH0028979.1 glycosyltransferase family protein [Pseudoalteromonas sp. SWN29]